MERLGDPDYDSLFAENLDLLLTIRDNVQVHWSGKHRAPLAGQAVEGRRRRVCHAHSETEERRASAGSA